MSQPTMLKDVLSSKLECILAWCESDKVILGFLKLRLSCNIASFFAIMFHIEKSYGTLTECFLRFNHDSEEISINIFKNLAMAKFLSNIFMTTVSVLHCIDCRTRVQ